MKAGKPLPLFEQMPRRREGRRRTAVLRTVTVGAVSANLEGGRSARYPYLRLRGRWLQRAGFRVGIRVAIAIRRNRLVITPLRERE